MSTIISATDKNQTARPTKRNIISRKGMAKSKIIAETETKAKAQAEDKARKDAKEQAVKDAQAEVNRIKNEEKKIKEKNKKEELKASRRKPILWFIPKKMKTLIFILIILNFLHFLTWGGGFNMFINFMYKFILYVAPAIDSLSNYLYS